MARARPFELGLELVADNAVEGLIGHFEPKHLAQPLLKLHRAGKPTRGSEACLELRKHGRREGLLPGRGSRLFVGQEGRQTSVTRAAEPGGHGIAMQGQMRRSLATGGHLPRLEQN